MTRFLPLALLLLAACPKDPVADGGFGAPKPVKDDGMVTRPAPVDAPLDFDGSVDVVPAFDKASGKLTVTLKIKPGYHAYAPGEEVGRPVEMAVDAPWAIDGKIGVPAGTKKDVGGASALILEGDVPLTAVVKGGTGDVKGVVTAQVCTDKACDRPKKHAFTVPSA